MNTCTLRILQQFPQIIRPGHLDVLKASDQYISQLYHDLITKFQNDEDFFIDDPPMYLFSLISPILNKTIIQQGFHHSRINSPCYLLGDSEKWFSVLYFLLTVLSPYCSRGIGNFENPVTENNILYDLIIGIPSPSEWIPFQFRYLLPHLSEAYPKFLYTIINSSNPDMIPLFTLHNEYSSPITFTSITPLSEEQRLFQQLFRIISKLSNLLRENINSLSSQSSNEFTFPSFIKAIIQANQKEISQASISHFTNNSQSVVTHLLNKHKIPLTPQNIQALDSALRLQLKAEFPIRFAKYLLDRVKVKISHISPLPNHNRFVEITPMLVRVNPSIVADIFLLQLPLSTATNLERKQFTFPFSQLQLKEAPSFVYYLSQLLGDIMGHLTIPITPQKEINSTKKRPDDLNDSPDSLQDSSVSDSDTDTCISEYLVYSRLGFPRDSGDSGDSEHQKLPLQLNSPNINPNSLINTGNLDHSSLSFKMTPMRILNQFISIYYLDSLPIFLKRIFHPFLQAYEYIDELNTIFLGDSDSISSSQRSFTVGFENCPPNSIDSNLISKFQITVMTTYYMLVKYFFKDTSDFNFSTTISNENSDNKPFQNENENNPYNSDPRFFWASPHISVLFACLISFHRDPEKISRMLLDYQIFIITSSYYIKCDYISRTTLFTKLIHTILAINEEKFSSILEPLVHPDFFREILDPNNQKVPQFLAELIIFRISIEKALKSGFSLYTIFSSCLTSSAPVYCIVKPSHPNLIYSLIVSHPTQLSATARVHSICFYSNSENSTRADFRGFGLTPKRHPHNLLSRSPQSPRSPRFSDGPGDIHIANNSYSEWFRSSVFRIYRSTFHRCGYSDAFIQQRVRTTHPLAKQLIAHNYVSCFFSNVNYFDKHKKGSDTLIDTISTKTNLSKIDFYLKADPPSLFDIKIAPAYYPYHEVQEDLHPAALHPPGVIEPQPDTNDSFLRLLAETPKSIYSPGFLGQSEALNFDMSIFPDSSSLTLSPFRWNPIPSIRSIRSRSPASPADTNKHKFRVRPSPLNPFSSPTIQILLHLYPQTQISTFDATHKIHNDENSIKLPTFDSRESESESTLPEQSLGNGNPPPPLVNFLLSPDIVNDCDFLESLGDLFSNKYNYKNTARLKSFFLLTFSLFPFSFENITKSIVHDWFEFLLSSLALISKIPNYFHFSTPLYRVIGIILNSLPFHHKRNISKDLFLQLSNSITQLLLSFFLLIAPSPSELYKPPQVQVKLASETAHRPLAEEEEEEEEEDTTTSLSKSIPTATETETETESPIGFAVSPIVPDPSRITRFNRKLISPHPLNDILFSIEEVEYFLRIIEAHLFFSFVTKTKTTKHFTKLITMLSSFTKDFFNHSWQFPAPELNEKQQIFLDHPRASLASMQERKSRLFSYFGNILSGIDLPMTLFSEQNKGDVFYSSNAIEYYFFRAFCHELPSLGQNKQLLPPIPVSFGDLDWIHVPLPTNTPGISNQSSLDIVVPVSSLRLGPYISTTHFVSDPLNGFGSIPNENTIVNSENSRTDSEIDRQIRKQDFITKQLFPTFNREKQSIIFPLFLSCFLDQISRLYPPLQTYSPLNYLSITLTKCFKPVLFDPKIPAKAHLTEYPYFPFVRDSFLQAIGQPNNEFNESKALSNLQASPIQKYGIFTYQSRKKYNVDTTCFISLRLEHFSEPLEFERKSVPKLTFPEYFKMYDILIFLQQHVYYYQDKSAQLLPRILFPRETSFRTLSRFWYHLFDSVSSSTSLIPDFTHKIALKSFSLYPGVLQVSSQRPALFSEMYDILLSAIAKKTKVASSSTKSSTASKSPPIPRKKNISSALLREKTFSPPIPRKKNLSPPIPREKNLSTASKRKHHVTKPHFPPRSTSKISFDVIEISSSSDSE